MSLPLGSGVGEVVDRPASEEDLKFLARSRIVDLTQIQVATIAGTYRTNAADHYPLNWDIAAPTHSPIAISTYDGGILYLLL